jgi:hypothetical protein
MELAPAPVRVTDDGVVVSYLAPSRFADAGVAVAAAPLPDVVGLALVDPHAAAATEIARTATGPATRRDNAFVTGPAVLCLKPWALTVIPSEVWLTPKP